MVEISVIIPVYNVEGYLEECLESVVNQSFNDLEIICINDGSTDNSLDILNKYAKMDDRIIIINQENKGLGAARNVGLDNANGDYIYFIDSDDYLELNALNELYHVALNNNVDLIIFKLLNFHDDTRETFIVPYHEMNSLSRFYDKIFTPNEIIGNILDFDVTVYSKFFKSDLISGMRFDEKLIFEDNLFTTEAILKSEKIYFYNKYLYYRRNRNESIMTSRFKNHMDTIEVSNNVFDKIKEYGYYNEVINKFFIKKINITYHRFLTIRDEYKETFFNKIKQDFLEKKEEFEKAVNFDKIDSKSKFIYYSAIDSHTFVEFELKNKLFESNLKIEKLETINDSLIKKNLRLENQLIYYVNQNKKIKNELKEVYSSNSWKITTPLRKIRNLK